MNQTDQLPELTEAEQERVQFAHMTTKSLLRAHATLSAQIGTMHMMGRGMFADKLSEKAIAITAILEARGADGAL